MAGRNFVKWKAENSPEKGQAPAFQTQRLILENIWMLKTFHVDWLVLGSLESLKLVWNPQHFETPNLKTVPTLTGTKMQTKNRLRVTTQHLWTCMIIALESNWKLQKLSTTFASVIYERRWGEELLWIKPEKSLKRKIIRSRLSSVSPSVQSLCPPCHLTETNGKQNSYILRWNLLFPGKFTFTAENKNVFLNTSVSSIEKTHVHNHKHIFKF